MTHRPAPVMTPTQPVWTVQPILQWTHQYFAGAGMASPRLDAELLLAFVCRCSRMDLYLNYEKPLTLPERDHYRDLVKKRAQGMPVAYLLGEKDFWTLTLAVRPGVLIPRPDTEILVEKASQAIQAWQEAHPAKDCCILEVGTGTGAIALALCQELEHLQIVALDVSELALEVAQENHHRYENLTIPRHNHVEWVQGNVLERFPAAKFDFLVSNPPYVVRSQIPQLQKEIALHEPHEALDGGEDGLDFYRHFFQHSRDFLKPEGEMLLEIGYNQAPALQAMLPQHLAWVETSKDLQSHPRVIHVKHPI